MKRLNLKFISMLGFIICSFTFLWSLGVNLFREKIFEFYWQHFTGTAIFTSCINLVLSLILVFIFFMYFYHEESWDMIKILYLASFAAAIFISLNALYTFCYYVFTYQFVFLGRIIETLNFSKYPGLLSLVLWASFAIANTLKSKSRFYINECAYILIAAQLINLVITKYPYNWYISWFCTGLHMLFFFLLYRQECGIKKKQKIFK